jgi:beta-glucosidase
VGEGNDATDLDLTGVQNELITALAGTGTPLVVVVLSGRVHTLGQVAPLANALLQLFPAGEEGGHGLADVLTGKVNPAARLPVTLPRSVGQVPIFAGQRAGGDRIPLFGDYVDSPATPLFAFGHGLSYTSFAYSDLCLHGKEITGQVEVTIDVTNTGEVAGDEVVQLYVRDDVASVARPERLLLGFARVSLAPGQCRRITFTVHPSRLAFYDAQMRFVTEPGTFTFSVGASSVDIRAEETLALEGPLVEYRQREIVETGVKISE